MDSDFEDKIENEADETAISEVEDAQWQTQVIRGVVSNKAQEQVPKAAAVRKPKPTFQAISTTIMVAVLMATLLTLWMPSVFTEETIDKQYLSEMTSTQTAEFIIEDLQVNLPPEFPGNRIGILIGHKGQDNGEVCENGLTELEVNSNVATYLQEALIGMGFEAELLDETDPRLVGYQAKLLIALHCNSCEYINDNATGFKFAIAPTDVRTIDREDLTRCLSENYANRTGLKYHYQTTTTEVRNYPAFDQLDPLTAAMIFELGYLNIDQGILVNQPQLLAEGIASGLQCYFADN